MIGSGRLTAQHPGDLRLAHWSLLLVLVMLTLMSGCGGADDEAGVLNARQAWKMVKDHSDIVVLDVRTRGEISRGMIPDALWIDFHGSQFKRDIAALDRERTYLIYCHSGVRSAVTIGEMRVMGFPDVRHLQGGIVEWQREGLPVVRPGKN